MAKLTRNQRAALDYALRNAERTYNYILSDRIAVCAIQDCATTTLHYTNPTSKTCLYPLEKAYGSDLVGIQNTIQTLRSVLATN